MKSRCSGPQRGKGKVVNREIDMCFHVCTCMTLSHCPWVWLCVGRIRTVFVHGCSLWGLLRNTVGAYKAEPAERTGTEARELPTGSLTHSQSGQRMWKCSWWLCHSHSVSVFSPFHLHPSFPFSSIKLDWNSLSLSRSQEVSSCSGWLELTLTPYIIKMYQ